VVNYDGPTRHAIRTSPLPLARKGRGDLRPRGVRRAEGILEPRKHSRGSLRRSELRAARCDEFVPARPGGSSPAIRRIETRPVLLQNGVRAVLADPGAAQKGRPAEQNSPPESGAGLSNQTSDRGRHRLAKAKTLGASAGHTRWGGHLGQSGWRPKLRCGQSQPASEERLHSERKGAVTQVDSPAEGTLRDSFEATDGPTLAAVCRPSPSVAASPRVDPDNGENLRVAKPQPTCAIALHFHRVTPPGRRQDQKARRELTRTHPGSRGWPPLRPRGPDAPRQPTVWLAS
jgi:hypothetical protein